MTFWNQKTNQAAVQTVPNVMFLKSMSNLELCILVYTKEGIDAPEASQDNILIDIRSSSGVTLAKRSLPFLPTMVCCSKTSLIFLANEKRILMLDVQSNDWSCDRGSGVEFCKGKERIVDVAFDIDRFGVTNNILSLNAIKCLCASEKYLAIGLSDGSLVIYNLPYMSIEQILHVDCDPSTIEFNKSSTKISVVATTGILSLFEINLDSPCIDGAADSSQRIHKLPLERKDVWNVMWAEDHDDELAMMEKAKLIIISGQQVEEVANSCGYLMSFKDLSVKILLIEDLATSASINREGCIVDIKTKLLNELETKIGNGDLEDAYNFAQSNKFHMRLWTRLAEAALVALKLSMAEKCFVHCSDYFGIQFVKQLTLMTDKMKMRAEVDVYLKKFDEAENIYRDIDRRDLAIDLRKRLGDYVRAVQLLRSGSVDNDDDVQKSLDSIGDDFSDRLMWTKASRCYAESGNTLKQLKCSVKYTKKYDDIRKLIASIPDGCKWMTEAAHMLEAAGLHKEASECFLRSGDVKASIDCHIAHNQWKEALALAEEHSFHQVEGLFTRLTTKLALDTHISKKLEAVDLFRVADRPQEAAMLIAEIAEIVAREECDPLMAKRLQVLAALEVERHRKRQHLSLHSTSDVSGMAKTTLATFDTMMMTSLDTQSSGASKRASNAFSSAWRGAAAYHYFILAQRQLTAGKIIFIFRLHNSSIDFCCL